MNYTEIVDTTDGIRKEFEKLAENAGFEITKKCWDADTYDHGTFTFSTRQHALGFMMLVDRLEGYASQLLGPTNTVLIEIVYPSDEPDSDPWHCAETVQSFSDLQRDDA